MSKLYENYYNGPNFIKANKSLVAFLEDIKHSTNGFVYCLGLKSPFTVNKSLTNEVSDNRDSAVSEVLSNLVFTYTNLSNLITSLEDVKRQLSEVGLVGHNTDVLIEVTGPSTQVIESEKKPCISFATKTLLEMSFNLIQGLATMPVFSSEQFKDMCDLAEDVKNCPDDLLLRLGSLNGLLAVAARIYSEACKEAIESVDSNWLAGLEDATTFDEGLRQINSSTEVKHERN